MQPQAGKLKIYQIETTSWCSADCHYCPQPFMKRKKEHMTRETFEQCMRVMSNEYVALHHFGEPLLNKDLPWMIRKAREYGKEVEFSTNGSVHNIELLREVLDAAPYMIRVHMVPKNAQRTPHRYEEFIQNLLVFNRSTVLKMHAVEKGLLPDFKPFNNFAGAVEGESEIRGDCYYIKYGYCVVLADGSIVPCCQDVEGVEKVGNVYHPEEVRLKQKYPLCVGCTGMQFAVDGKWKAE